MRSRQPNGFTLVEILIVVAIIAIITAIAVPQLLGSRQKSIDARVQEDLRTFAQAAQALYDDTGRYPGNLAEMPCVNGVEYYVTDCRVGLFCTNGSFRNWRGPYLTASRGFDPWGNRYIYDTDYHKNNRIGRVFHSGGKNKSGLNVYDDDNRVIYVCSATS